MRCACEGHEDASSSGTPRQERECLAEVRELEAARERLATLFESPAVGNVHVPPPLKCRSCRSSWAAKESSMATQVADQTSILGLDNPMGTDGFEFVEY